jgi:hypothetical protein
MKRQQAVHAVKYYLLAISARVDKPLDEGRAHAIAKAVIADFGDLRGFTAQDLMRSFWSDSGIIPDWPRIRGWRVKGQRRRLSLWDLVIGPRKRAEDAKVKAEIEAATVARIALRRARAALADRPDAPERQRRAFELVRVEGLTLRDAGLKMTIAASSVFNLIKRFERGLTKSPDRVRRSKGQVWSSTDS